MHDFTALGQPAITPNEWEQCVKRAETRLVSWEMPATLAPEAALAEATKKLAIATKQIALSNRYAELEAI